MNLTTIVTDLNTAGIIVRKFTVHYEAKEIILDINFGGDIEKLGIAMQIVDKHLAAYKAAGFILRVSYGMLYS